MRRITPSGQSVRSLENAERSLYRAARAETPDPSACERTLEALQRAALGHAAWSDPSRVLVSRATWGDSPDETQRSRTSPWRRSWPFALAAAIVVLAVAFDLRAPWRSARTAKVVAQAVADVPRAPVSTTRFSSSPGVLEAPEAPAATAIPVPTPPSTARTQTRSPKMLSSLPAEIDALDRVRAALRVHDPRRALDTLAEYDRVLGGFRLRDEATLLRIEALQGAGLHREAAALAHRFVAANPDSPLDDRALRLVEVESARPAPSPAGSP